MRHLRNQIVGQNNTQNVDIDITEHKLQLIGLLYYYRYIAFHNATRTYAFMLEVNTCMGHLKEMNDNNTLSSRTPN